MSYIKAGKAKGIKLETPYVKGRLKSSVSIRIASNRFKEGVFSIIQTAILDANVLDLFCGIGSFGIEALSRGAKYCDFVDQSKQAESFIYKNLEKTRFSHRASFFNIKVEDFLGASASLEEKYRIVFIDPPYNKITTEKITDILERLCEFLEPKAIVILKHDKTINPPQDIKSSFGTLSLDKQKKYAVSIASVYFFE
ncbi:RsmD family RNA methyltransferase [Candidatus Dojkabacteria bacterium]|nr:RsmD family RNA methyltransferase [Candidatus Dojkabacteria bacterium]